MLLRRISQALGYTPPKFDMPLLLVSDKVRQEGWAERLTLVQAKLALAIGELSETGKASLSKKRLEKAMQELAALEKEMKQ